ncbi:Bifunctional transcriptional activator/DNA repair enzyme Ada [Pseudocercospora fuligena]|uniref:Bifunctional transcriptional activator/DNA repair enzyme Ada n=1 Tax=Pseudocercospora fuligena TaxID=685502 RepID=A0A8H6RP69_9PEZI|nr:Bifunctional transcriptional activator/DNA repair enzyme Ada [Pseudocercospora fuligena]
MADVLFRVDSERWNAVRARDPLADGCFVYCVKTTKIYCRPICKARLARRSNVEFFATIPEAMQAGYRACKRCKPELDTYIPEGEQSIFKIQRLLEDLPEGAPLPKLEVLASEAGLTKYHFHRSFKKATGMTPREYALSRRRARLFDAGPRPESGDGSCISTPSLTTDSAVLSLADASPEAIQTPLFDLGDWEMVEFDAAHAFDTDAAFVFSPKESMSFGTMSLSTHSNELPLNTYDQPSSSIPIFYSMAETKNGALLVAFDQAQICKMELASSAVDVLTSLHNTFPFPNFVLVPIEQAEPEERRQQLQGRVAAVITAMEQPAQT